MLQLQQGNNYTIELLKIINQCMIKQIGKEIFNFPNKFIIFEKMSNINSDQIIQQGEESRGFNNAYDNPFFNKKFQKISKFTKDINHHKNLMESKEPINEYQQTKMQFDIKSRSDQLNQEATRRITKIYQSNGNLHMKGSSKSSQQTITYQLRPPSQYLFTNDSCFGTNNPHHKINRPSYKVEQLQSLKQSLREELTNYINVKIMEQEQRINNYINKGLSKLQYAQNYTIKSIMTQKFLVRIIINKDQAKSKQNENQRKLIKNLLINNLFLSKLKQDLQLLKSQCANLEMKQ